MRGSGANPAAKEPRALALQRPHHAAWVIQGFGCHPSCRLKVASGLASVTPSVDTIDFGARGRDWMLALSNRPESQRGKSAQARVAEVVGFFARKGVGEFH